MISHENIPANLVKFRIMLGWPQQELAERGNFHVTAISHWETGERVPSVKNLIRLSQTFQCHVESLLS